MNADQGTIIAKLQELRSTFADAHRRGMACLERRDLEGFDAALTEERLLIEEQGMLIQQLRDSSQG